MINPNHCLPTYNVNNPVSHLIQHIRPDPTNILPKFIPRFEKIRWGDFRQQRFEGDVANIGDEIQIEHFQSTSTSTSTALKID